MNVNTNLYFNQYILINNKIENFGRVSSISIICIEH